MNTEEASGLDPEAIHWVSVGTDSVPSVVAETAQQGSTTTTKEVDVPETPIRVEDDAYYRVYLDQEVDDPSTAEHRLAVLVRYIAPLVGLYMLVRLSRRIRVTYVGDGE